MGGLMTLVLNADYSIHASKPWKKVMHLVFKNKVFVLKEYDGVSVSFKIPAVVLLKKFITYRPRGIVLTNKTLFARDGFTCQYCGKSASELPEKTGSLSRDHIIPRVKGGKDTWENVTTCCKRCNSKKGSKSLEEAGMKLLTVPVRPEYLNMASVTIPKEWSDFIDYLRGQSRQC